MKCKICGIWHSEQTGVACKLGQRIAELEGVLRSVLEDIEHKDHEAGDWSQQVVVKHARKVLGDQEVV